MRLGYSKHLFPKYYFYIVFINPILSPSFNLLVNYIKSRSSSLLHHPGVSSPPAGTQKYYTTTLHINPEQRGTKIGFILQIIVKTWKNSCCFFAYKPFKTRKQCLTSQIVQNIDTSFAFLFEPITKATQSASFTCSGAVT